ncbi:MAG: NAD(+) synthase [Clostridiaceae bacterium]|nr:NAD(+) synthase [Clostridiaceae bacterium]
MKYGYARVAAASPELKVADCSFNTKKIIDMIKEAEKKSVEFLVFPELCITGYTCADLFRHNVLLDGAINSILAIAEATRDTSMVVIVGLPLSVKGRLYNCAAVIQKGKILGIVPKSNLPGYNEFYEQRWFTEAEHLEVSQVKIGEEFVPIGGDIIFTAEEDENIAFGIEICEDLWVPVPPSSFLAQAGAMLIFNLSASNELVGKADYRKGLVEGQSARCVAGYVYASSNCGESSTDLVYGGHLIIAENGLVLSESERFYFENKMIMADIDLDRLSFNRVSMGTFRGGKGGRSYRNISFSYETKDNISEELLRPIPKHPFVPNDISRRDERCREILSIQTSGLEKRIRHTGLDKLVIAISGGLDSTLAFIVAARAIKHLNLPLSNIIAITMPGFGTTGRTYNNAISLIKGIGATLRVVDIKEACLRHFIDIEHDKDIHDTTYENVQARERTQVLMDVANKIGGLVVGTGDLSELALGWCTYNGDHMSMYGVNSGVPKTLVKHIIQWYADYEANEEIRKVLYDIIDTPISPELLPPSKEGKILQKTEDILGPYEVHDFFLYNMLRCGTGPDKNLFLAQKAFDGEYSREQLKKWMVTFYKRFFSQQFKRSCLPDGPKVGTVSLSPRGDWRMPSDAEANLWLSAINDI